MRIDTIKGYSDIWRLWSVLDVLKTGMCFTFIKCDARTTQYDYDVALPSIGESYLKLACGYIAVQYVQSSVRF